MIKKQTTDDDDDRILKDGETLRVPVYMMDSTRRAINTSRTLPMTDTDQSTSEKLYEQRNQRLSEAWKNPPPLYPAQVKTDIVPDPATDAYARRDQRLRNAWKGL